VAVFLSRGGRVFNHEGRGGRVFLHEGRRDSFLKRGKKWESF
jgi:hypothetical protein